MDGDDNLYLIECHRIQKRDPQGNWSRLPREVGAPCYEPPFSTEARDPAGNTYFFDQRPDEGGIMRRDPGGNGTRIAEHREGIGQVGSVFQLLSDSEGRLSVVDRKLSDPSSPVVAEEETRIQRRNPDGAWTLLASSGALPGQVRSAFRAKLDASGNLYAVDFVSERRMRLQRWVRGGNPAVLLAPSGVLSVTEFEIDSKGDVYLLDPLGSRVLFIPAASIPEHRGDVNLNGAVDIPDAVIALRAAVKLNLPTYAQVAAGDFDGTGDLGVGDAVRILRPIVGL